MSLSETQRATILASLQEGAFSDALTQKIQALLSKETFSEEDAVEVQQLLQEELEEDFNSIPELATVLADDAGYEAQVAELQKEVEAIEQEVQESAAFIEAQAQKIAATEKEVNDADEALALEAVKERLSEHGAA